DRVTRPELGEQRCRNQRCGAAGEDRGQLVPDRGAAIAQPAGEAFGDQRRLRAVHHVVRDQRQHDCKEYPATLSCRSKTSSSEPSKRSAQRCAPVSASISWPAMRTRLAALRTEPSSTYRT